MQDRARYGKQPAGESHNFHVKSNFLTTKIITTFWKKKQNREKYITYAASWDYYRDTDEARWAEPWSSVMSWINMEADESAGRNRIKTVLPVLQIYYFVL